MSENNWAFETLQVHAGQVPDEATGARALPIYQTTSFVFKDTEQAANRFALSELGPIYTRITNPTTGVIEDRITAFEGGTAGLMLASGQAAETYAIMNLAEAGDHIVSSSALYGGTFNLLNATLPRFGIETSFVTDVNNVDAWRAAIRPNTKALYGETIANPSGEVLDIEAIAVLAHEHGIPLIVDNTIGTPYLVRPFEFGADIVVHSATKYLGGHGTSIGGVIVDSGNFDFSADPEKFPMFNTPDPSYHGIRYGVDLGAGGALGANVAFAMKARVQLLRDMGAPISPFNAFLIGQGIETLSLRMERHLENTHKVAAHLGAQEQVEKVYWATLPDHSTHAQALKYTPKGSGAVLAFDIAGGVEAGKRFVEALELHSHVANLGDVRSLAIHPASTTHWQGDDAGRLAAGVTPGLVRLAVGIEHIDDIIADLDKGFAAARG